jgi:hypothetical protein
MSFLSAKDLEERLFPAVITLSNDIDNMVRLATVKQLCNVSLIVSTKELIEKIDVQIDTMLSNPTQEIICEIVREFTRIIPSVSSLVRDMCK